MRSPDFRPQSQSQRPLGPALSALADGEADIAETSALLRAWPEQGLREQWQTYQLIGDSLRSAELAHDIGRGEDLLARLRPQLLAEPRIVAAQARLQRWLAPAAVAAGFVALAAGLTNLPVFIASPPNEVLAAAPSTRPLLVPAPALSFAQSAGLAGDALLVELPPEPAVTKDSAPASQP
ncbi:sigma-E factor negative regulatory protein [Paucibacter sp. PLA-PC-4]|uniref:sigma-E factor negative regulatory protein n=1 Tax=Paucibacter sp. PLA-PC-4 TaxID=2993655 RepID=UPI00224AB5B2|nr:sigma-E factor negative regulatory protein [Paucibacter sp. PLA-PC-4]MCX2865157.1 sigma-E factor negative regulatory protein [Paucibacter sp. PLA-PC-4]